jgi:hypothetical protein
VADRNEILLLRGVMAEAKGKIKRRHQHAIEQFEAWLKAHPNATHGQKFGMFNALVDSAALHVELQRHERKERVGS